MAKQKHTALYLGGAGIGGLLAYNFLYKPWKMAQDAAALANQPAPSWFTSTGGGGGGGGFLPPVTFPSQVGPQPSNLNPGAQVGGPVGYCMWKKGWTQQQCADRLNALTSAYQAALAEYNKLSSGASSAEANSLIASAQAAIDGQMASYNQAMASGNIAQASQIKLQIDAWNAQIANAQQLLSTIASRIANYKTAINGHIDNYYALTGQVLGQKLS